MASPPIERLIENPGTGERIRLLTRAEETGGRLLAFELHLEPGGRVPAPHRHPGQEESFQVLEGRLRFRVGLRARVLGPGDAITVPVGAPHGFSNPGPTPALVRVEVRPALRTAELLEVGARLGARPGPLKLARFLAEFAAEVSSPLLPRLVTGVARRLTRLAGQSTAF